ncbi:MAG: chromate transporter [Mogibacterium sp.]|nr:chromate transporter [Mogibacterium sp.]
MSTLIELFTVFFKLGAFTIGGGIAMLPLLQNSLIHEKKWFTEEEFVDAVAICQGLPGIIAVNMATYVGYKKKGLLGSAVSTFAVVMPSFVMILIIAKFLTSISDNPYVAGAMAGFRVAALGLVVVAIIQLAPKVLKGVWTVAAAVLAFVLIAVFNINTAYVILLFIILGIAVTFSGRDKVITAADTTHSPDTDGEKGGDEE